REKPENRGLEPCVMPPATVDHCPLRPSFWMAYWAPSRPGWMTPEKRTFCPGLTVRWLTCDTTLTATATVATGLITLPSVVSTRSCIVVGSASAAKVELPPASVTTALPTLVKPDVYGKARCWWTTCL